MSVNLKLKCVEASRTAQWIAVLALGRCLEPQPQQLVKGRYWIQGNARGFDGPQLLTRLSTSDY
eukprot:scaffold156649_cov27-Prasinocladus_malaysianus.AAC.1